MTKQSIDSIIIKFLNDEATSLELSQLTDWLEADPENIKKFKDYLAINHTLNKDLIFDAIQAYQNAFDGKKEVKIVPLYRKPIFRYAVAAAVVILLTLPFVIKNPETEILEPIIVNNTIKAGTDKATLTLEDGTEIVLEKGQEYIADNLISNGEELVYDEAVIDNQEIAYNYLTIPRGGQYYVKLSDGTQVWLNSESQLKYPKNFRTGEIREVELVYGEAYFDVSPSTAHNGDAFKVKTVGQDIQVLGTEFNVKAYQDEPHVYTTLVEGSVSVSIENESQILSPNQQADLDVANVDLSVSEVNVYSEISWKDGVFSFKNKPLKKIMKTLSRWYDMDVVFLEKDLEQVTFTGVVRKQQSIEEILSAIKSETIRNYQIHDKTILIQ